MKSFKEIVLELAAIPAGSLIAQSGNHYIYQYYDHGLRQQPSVPANLIDAAVELDKRRHDLENELFQYFQTMSSASIEETKKFLREERHKVLARIVTDHKPYPETHNIYTLHGDFVSSKSEALISMVLVELKVKFHYEKRLQINTNYAIFPDFTLIINGKEYYYEHLGKMHEASYRTSWQKRRQDYHSINIYEGDLLFTTEEYDNVLDLLQIRRQLEKFIQSKK